MSNNEAPRVDGERSAHRVQIRRDVAEIRRLLAERGHPVPDDATEEEMIETIKIVAKLIGPGGIFSPGTSMLPSD